MAPDLDLARDPRWGCVEETYGEEPYLTGVKSHGNMGIKYVFSLELPCSI